MATYDEAILKATEIGVDHGTDAASWVIDGNTTEEAIRRLHKGIEDGDPEVLDQLPTTWLSGEFADTYSERDLSEDCEYSDSDEGWDEIVGAYTDAFNSAVVFEVSRITTLHLKKDVAR